MQENIHTNWNLARYFYSSIQDPQIEKDFSEYKDFITNNIIKKYPQKIRNLGSKEEWTEFFEDVDEHEVHRNITKIFLYFNYEQSLDTQNQEVIKQLAIYSNKARDLQEQLLFLDEEFKAIGFETLMELSKKEDLENFSKFFIDKANTLKYELDTPIERALLLTSQARAKNCNTQLFEELHNSFEFKFRDEEGNEKVGSEEDLMFYVQHENRELREQVHTSLKGVYLQKSHQITLGNVYSSIVKDSVATVKLRSYNTVMSPRNLGEDMEDETINFLLKEVEEKLYPLYKRFLELKKKALGVESLRPWDISAPLGELKTSFKFEDGVELLLETFKEVNQELYEYSKEMFEQERVDVFSKKGKRGGAYCSYYKKFDSMVLLNYNATLNDISTIAHEFGHAYHGHLLQSQPTRYYDTGLCIAETASVFNELLLSSKLLEKLNNLEKLYVLNDELGGFFGTITRQIMYIMFEKRVHESFYNDEELTYTDFNVMFREEQEKLTQGIVEFATSKEEDFSWSRIPHIYYTPFYCYSYAFGQILSISLFEKFNQSDDKQEFFSMYKKFLQTGSSKTPKEALLEIGVDINSEEFYDKAVEFISSKLDEFENVLKEEKLI
ncbi:MAG: M3 family metallopeptidase [Nanoarchaeota archaeon]|nr:M3 family metallopeptidase [Nanoarchaeota archaeon]